MQNKCAENWTLEQTKTLFENFWKLGDFDAQNLFLAGNVKQSTVERRRPRVRKNKITKNEKKHAKDFARVYSVFADNKPVTVCKPYFSAIFDISSGRLNRALVNQRENGGVSGKDGRGKYDHKTQRIHEEHITHIKDHIRMFPTYESHYTRSHSASRRFLPAHLTVSTMYDMYREKCIQDSVEPQKEWKFRDIFNHEFNLTFHQPLKDTCKKCDIFKTDIEIEKTEHKKSQLKAAHEIHLRKAEKARQSLKLEKENEDNKHASFCFDLQKVMSLPCLTTNEVYYCRQLSMYNLGIHDLKNDNAVMNVWHEGTASRGAGEIGSCLLAYCQNLANRDITSITAFSDSCGGQNRNIKIALLWMHLTQTTSIELVNHKFMVSGHSYLPNDADFGIIERTKPKSTEIFVPEQWYKLIENCSMKKRFSVARLSTDNFKSVEPLLKLITNRKVDESDQKVNWLDMQWLQLRKNEPYKLFFKYSLDDDASFSFILLAKRGRQTNLSEVSLAPLYCGATKLSKEKYSDLMKLLKYIPPIYHDFYQKLEHSGHNKDVLEDELLLL